MESIPEMITMMIEPPAFSITTSTQITLSGFTPSTTYYKYQDDYHNLTEFITDENGSYSYFQDLSKPYFVFIQPRKSTKFIKDDATGGDCNLIGIWDATTKTCTLTQDVYETIQIDSNGIIIDGNGHTITGFLTIGIYLSGKSNVVVKNLNIKSLSYGMYFVSAYENVLKDNNFFSNSRGIYLVNGFKNSISNNKLELNSRGITIDYGSYNNIINNMILGVGNYYSHTGIVVFGSYNNLISNTIDGYRSRGIYISGYDSYGNKLKSNIISNNSIGLDLAGDSYENEIVNNTVFNNRNWDTPYLGWGVSFYGSNNNKMYNNNFINNPTQTIAIYPSYGNIFNLNKPIGGNYWSNFNEPIEGCNDLNNDNLCDSPYVFSGGQDNLPWTKQDGWKQIPQNQPPTLSFLPTGPYAGDGIDPNKGTANSTPFFFNIIYTDADNNPPSNVTLVVDNGITVSRYAMMFDTEASDALRDGNYTNGEQYTFALQFPRGDYRYYFEVADETNTVKFPSSNSSFRSGLIVAVKSSANIRSDRGISASIIIGVAQKGDLLELFPLCSETGDINCNDDTLLYTLKDGHYWLKVKWNNSVGFIAEDLVMTVISKNQPERVKKIMTEIFAQPDFTAIQSFPVELLLTIAAYESGGALNNEIVSGDSPFSGVMQVHPATGRENTNCIGKICEQIKNYWINIIHPFTDLFEISTDQKEGKVFQYKNYINTEYQNTDTGLKNNLEDGLNVLKEKYRPRCPKESLFFADPSTGINYEVKCSDMEKIRAVWAYNGFGGNYLLGIFNALRNLSDVFSNTFYHNNDQLIEKLALANNHKIEVKKYSPVGLRVQNSSGEIVGEFNGEVKDEIYNAAYDPETESIGIFFPRDEYTYIVFSKEPGTYGLETNIFNGTTTTNFLAIDIPIKTNEVHQYTIDKEALIKGEEGVKIFIDTNGDGIFEKAVVSDGKLTQDDYLLQTETKVNIAPDSVNLKNKNGVITVYIKLPEGFNLNGIIDASSITLNGISPLSKPITIGDYDNDGIPDLTVKFDRGKIVTTISSNKNSATMTIKGKIFHNGETLPFKGEDIIKMIH